MTDELWGRLVPAAYENFLESQLNAEAHFSNLLSEAADRRKQRHAEWWAEQSFWSKLRYRARKLRSWLRQKWDDFRFWLSNLIYKHEEREW